MIKNFEVLIKNTRCLLKRDNQQIISELNKISNKELKEMFDIAFSNLPFKIHFMKEFKENTLMARLIDLTSLKGFKSFKKEYIINELPTKINNELVEKYFKLLSCDKKIKLFAIYLPFYQVNFSSCNKNIYNDSNPVCLFGDFEFEYEERS